MLDEFEEYCNRAFVNKRSRRVSSRDDACSIPGTKRLQNKMRMRPSFKSDSAYSARRRQTPEQELLVQRVAELSLQHRDSMMSESVESVFESKEDTDCDLQSEQDCLLSDDDDILITTTFQPPSAYHPCLTPVRVSVGRSHITAYSTMTPSPPTHHRSRSCRVRTRHPTDGSSPKIRNRRRTYSVPTRSRCHRRHMEEQNEEEEEENTEDSYEYDDDFYRVRTFCTSAKGIVNRGDSFKKKPLSAQSSLEGSKSDASRNRTLSATSQDSSACSTDSTGTLETPHTVLVMGSNGVGISSLLRQFMTSEYMGNADTVLEEGTLPSVSVLLDGTESTLEFADISDAEEVTSECGADAFVVVYAVNDRESFDDAVMCLHELRKRELLAKTATILVANKGDIVRGREVEEEEAKVMAVRYGCKYIEVSAVLHLKVDELLAGILKQIRLNDKRKRKARKKAKNTRISSCVSQDNGCIPQPLGIVSKLLGKGPYVFRSCDNLLVL